MEDNKTVMENDGIETSTSFCKESIIIIKGHPVMERPLETMADFRKNMQMIFASQDLANIAKDVGLQLECGCHVPSAKDEEYVRYNIPKTCIPLPRPYQKDCDVPDCLRRAVMQKYLEIHLSVRKLNAPANFLPFLERRIKNSIAKNCAKMNLCFFHFEENFIEDCPDCAYKYGLVNLKGDEK